MMDLTALEMELRKTGSLSVSQILDLIDFARNLKREGSRKDEEISYLERWEDRFQALSEASSSTLEEVSSTLEEITGDKNSSSEVVFVPVDEDFPADMTVTGNPNKSFEPEPTRKTSPLDALSKIEDGSD